MTSQDDNDNDDDDGDDYDYDYDDANRPLLTSRSALLSLEKADMPKLPQPGFKAKTNECYECYPSPGMRIVILMKLC